MHRAALVQDRPREVVATADVVEVDDRVGRVAAGCEPKSIDLLQRVPQHRAVRPHDALRLAGRARREDDLVRVVHAAGASRAAPPTTSRTPRRRRGRRRRRRARSPCAGRAPRRCGAARAIVPRKRSSTKIALACRAAQQIGELAVAQAPVQRHHDRARRRRCPTSISRNSRRFALSTATRSSSSMPEPDQRVGDAARRRRAARRRCASGPRRRSAVLRESSPSRSKRYGRVSRFHATRVRDPA